MGHPEEIQEDEDTWIGIESVVSTCGAEGGGTRDTGAGAGVHGGAV